jgi:flagellar hook-associated protein 2
MGVVTFSGLASGLDTTSIVSSMVGVAKVPMTRVQTQQTNLNSQSTQLSNIKTKLAALQTAAKALDSKTKALGNKVTSSDTTILSATASGGSSMGSFPVTVKSLAQADRTYSNAFASDGAAGLAGAGTLGIQVGTGDPINIQVDDTDTLATIAQKINSSGAGVSVGVFHDGTNYRLQATGTQTGAANAITFTEGGSLSLGLTDPTNKKQTAADAVINIDGIDVHSATNQVSGAVPGVTLTVAKLGSSVVDVGRDGDGLKTKLQTFVTAYNDVMKTLNATFTFTGVAKGEDSLVGDTNMRNLQNSLRSLASSVMGNSGSQMTSFGSMGVVSSRDGTLSIDDTKFSAAVAKDYDGIASLLAGKSGSNGLMSTIFTGVDRYVGTGGTIDTEIQSKSKQSKMYDTQLASMQLRLDKYTQTLNDQFTALESTMSDLKNQGNSLANILNQNSSSSK